MQSCARCGFVVYPAEKINCIDQVTHLYSDTGTDSSNIWVKLFF